MTVNYDKNLKGAKNRLELQQITSKNKKLIISFLDRLAAEGITKTRQLKYLYTLTNISKILKKDFPVATKQDIIKLCREINNSEYAEWTKHDYMVAIKRFYKWLREEEGQNLDRRQYPDEVKWIIPKVSNGRKKLPNELLTIEDIKKLADCTNNLRDRAFVLLLYESGARIGEVLNLRLKDVEPDKYGAKITLDGKTGQRKIRLIASTPALNLWLERGHPDKDNKNSMLFCGLWAKKKAMDVEYQTFRLMLADLAKKAGITKPINPHHFRHSRATELSKNFTEAQLCQYMGWEIGSGVAATYIHLSGRDMDDAILKLNGLAGEVPEASKFKATKCPRCGIMNSPESKACPHCGIPLDIQSVMEYEKTSKETLKTVDNKETIELLSKQVLALAKEVEQLRREKYEK